MNKWYYLSHIFVEVMGLPERGFHLSYLNKNTNFLV